MIKPKQKAREICEMYHNGICISDIAKHYGNIYSNIIQILQHNYFKIYGDNFKTPGELKKEKYNKLYEEFMKIYIPFAHSRKYYVDKLKCTVVELSLMFKKYNLKNLRLKTSVKQKTLCNVPYENFKYYSTYCKKNNISRRQLACTAINEYILREMMKGE